SRARPRAGATSPKPCSPGAASPPARMDTCPKHCAVSASREQRDERRAAEDVPLEARPQAPPAEARLEGLGKGRDRQPAEAEAEAEPEAEGQADRRAQDRLVADRSCGGGQQRVPPPPRAHRRGPSTRGRRRRAGARARGAPSAPP